MEERNLLSLAWIGGYKPRILIDQPFLCQWWRNLNLNWHKNVTAELALTQLQKFFQNDAEDIVAETFQTSDRAYFVTNLIFAHEKMVVQRISITISLN